MMMSSPVRRAWALTLLWIAVIALESFGGSSERTGHLLYPVLRFLFPKITATRMSDLHFLIRKAGHFFGYCVLSLLLYRAWWTTVRQDRRDSLRWTDMFRDWSWRAALLALLCTVSVAGLDEWHQSFSPGRTASAADVALDESGGFLAQTAILVSSSVAVRTVRRRKLDQRPVTSA